MIKYSDKIYKRVKSAGSMGIVLGILSITVGLAVGILSIVFGGMMVRTSNDLMD